MSRPAHEPPRRPARCAVVTISDTKRPADDRSGAALMERIQRYGHQVVQYSVVSEEVIAVRTAVQTLALGTRVDLLMTIGSSGVGPRDCALEALRPVIDVPVPGFGELLRAMSFEAVGPRAMLSRTSAGRAGRCFVFCLPGSEDAVTLAWDRIILPQVDHLLAMLGR